MVIWLLMPEVNSDGDDDATDGLAANLKTLALDLPVAG